MKTVKIFATITAFVLSSVLFFTSCKKKTQEDNDTTEAQDHTMAENTSNDVINMSGQVSENGSLSSYRSGGNEDPFSLSCATITRDTIHLVDSVVFNGGVCMDGRVRTGSLAFHYGSNAARHYRNPGFSCSVKSYNYVVDGNAVNIIQKSITNTTPANFNPATTNLTWSISDNISIVKANGGGTITFTSSRTKTLLNTSDPNVYHGQAIPISWNLARIGIDGNASGTTAHGNSFTAATYSQLVRDMTCSPDVTHPGHHPFIQGVLHFTPSGKAVRIIDYGTGACDLTATVTINNVSHTITLH